MADTGPKCILVIEDDDSIRDLVTDILQSVGYRVERAADGLQALVKVSVRRPDIIVLDLMMPVMDGWTFLEHFRKNPECSATPVVVTSAYTTLGKTARELHVEAFLAKPFDMDALVGVVERLL